MKITILCPNVSSNALGRAYLLYSMLENDYEVEIIGPASNGRIWEPLAHDDSIRITVSRSRRIVKQIDGDVILASKPLLGSYGAGMAAKFRKGKKLILDIDDWQLGFVLDEYGELSLPKKIMRFCRDVVRFYWINSIVNTYLSEKLVFYADRVTVSNGFLKKRFGGDLVRHTRDPEALDPQKYDRMQLRKKYHFSESDKIVIFPGTRRPHKGLEALIRAVSLIGNEEVKLLMLGSSDDLYSEKIETAGIQTLGHRFYGVGMVPMKNIPEYLAISDIVVIPQDRSRSSAGQFPVKIFDAMAMGKPVITTRVSDHREIIGDTGWVIGGDDENELKESIEYAFDHPEERVRKGRQARKRFIEHFSLEIERQKLLKIVGDVAQK